jgi:hypothetical protein
MRGAGRLARRALPGAVALAAAAACAPATVWERPDTSARQAETDRTECAAAADDGRYVLRYRTVTRGGQVDQVLMSEPEHRFDVERYEACLRSRGYRPVPRPAPSPAAAPPASRPP